MQQLWRSIYPLEKIVASMLLVSAVCFFIFRLPFEQHYNLYWGQLKIAGYWYLFSLFVCFLVLMCHSGLKKKRAGQKLSEGELWQDFKGSYINWQSFFRILRLMNAVMLMFVAFAQLKHLIPHINSAVYDAQLLALEQAALGGRSSADLLHAFFGFGAAPLISNFYKAYYFYLLIGISLLIFQRNARLAQEYCAAFALMWFLGVIMVYVYPSWGPCFFTPDKFAFIADTGSGVLQQALWQAKLALEIDPKSSQALFAISGLPSLHLAVTILGSIYIAKLSRFLGVLSWIFVALTIVSTLYLGWHYLWDDLAAFALVPACIWLARKFNYSHV